MVQLSDLVGEIVVACGAHQGSDVADVSSELALPWLLYALAWIDNCVRLKEMRPLKYSSSSLVIRKVDYAMQMAFLILPMKLVFSFLKVLEWSSP